MTTNTIHCDYASETFTTSGPTGNFREVLEAQVEDYGGNVLAGPGPVEEVAARKFRVATRIVPTKLGVSVASADTLTQCHLSD